MAFLKKLSVECLDQNSLNNLANQVNFNKQKSSPISVSSNIDVKYKSLSGKAWMEHFLNGHVDVSYYNSRTSQNLVDFVSSRSVGNTRLQRASVDHVFGTKHILKNELFRERHFHLDRLNKVFSSQWLNDRQVVFGTKCNKLVVLDVYSGQKHLIPTLKSTSQSIPPEFPCGIHSIQVNPSRTLLATGGDNPNDVAIYKLPTMDPICVGERAHDDWIFDFAWLDDEFLISGSRDTKLALWRVNSDNESLDACELPSYNHVSPLAVRKCANAEKIRALLFNRQLDHIVALSLNAQLHLFDAKSMKQKYSIKLKCLIENVCLAQEVDRNLYAVGSKSHVSLWDARNHKLVETITSKYSGCGIRSLSFGCDLLTIGTGVGVMMFYDIRNMKYLENSNSKKPTTVLKATKGWVYPDELYQEVFMNLEYNPAIYTHQYDSSRTRLFAAGGPLPASLQGNYAGLWR